MYDDHPVDGADGEGSDDRTALAKDPAVSRRDVLKATGAGVAATGLGLTGAGTASASEHGINTPWLEVEGNKVLDPMGNEVILRGVNIPDPKRLDHTVSMRGKNWNHMIDLATDHERGWYANVIRIPAHPGDIAELPPVPVAEDSFHDPVSFTEEELVSYCENYLDPVVEYCRQQNVYCIVDYHRHWGDGDLKWHDDDLDEEVRMFWNTVAPRYAEDSHVIFEVYNEPTLPAMYIDDWYNAKYAGIWRRWKKTAQPWVDIIREHAPDNLIVVGSPGWSAMPEGAQIEEFDGGNLMYAYHIYGGHGLSSDEEFDSRQTEEGTNSVWKDVPLFMTEFGWEPGQNRWISGETDGFGRAVTEWADERPIHWTAWCFDITWLPSMWERAFVEESGPDDAVGDPYSEEIPELCSDPPCEWNLLGRDVGDYSKYAGEYIRETLEKRKDDDLPQVDHDTTPPAVPADIAASGVDERSAELSWSAVTETGETPLAHYVVTVDGTEWLETTETSAVVEDLIAGTSQELGVNAVDEYGNVSDPATVEVTTDDVSAGEPPSPPAGLTLSDRTHRSVTLSWDGASASGSADIARYVVTFEGEEVARLRSDETTYRIDGLDLDTRYEVTVTAVDRTGQSSDPLTATVEPRPAHATEDDVLINDYEGEEPLTNNSLGGWVGGGLPSGVEDGVLQIEWDGITYHGTTVEVDATDTPYLKFLARGEDGYELSMLALKAGDSDDGKPVGGITDDRIGTDWSVVTIDLEAAGVSLTPPGQLQFDSVWGTAGAFEIDEIWLAGEDTPAAGIEVGGTTEPTAPATPENLQTERVTATTVEFGWDAVANATGYLVSRDGEAVTDTASTSVTITGLDPETTYEFGVRADNAAGQSSMATVTVTTTTETTGTEPVPIGDAQPTDPDGDGLYEDLNGNGRVDSDDVVTYFKHKDEDAITEYLSAYDYNENGRIDFDDVTALFRQI